jgi:hypothetical protein
VALGALLVDAALQDPLADIATFATGDAEPGCQYAEQRLASRRVAVVAA